MKIERYFYDIVARSADSVVIAVTRDDTDGTEIIRYDRGAWHRELVKDKIDCLSLISFGDLLEAAYLNGSGHTFTIPASKTVERIGPAPPGLGGSLIAAAQIGTRLYACGMGGEFYRRGDDGHWAQVREDLLVSSEFYNRGRLFSDVKGRDENRIYIATGEGCQFWNGETLTPIGPSTLQIADIMVDVDETVWACGWEGVLLKGNHRDGLARIENPRDPMFLCLGRDGSDLFIGCNVGFYTYDGRRIEMARTGLHPEPSHISRFASAGDVLWGIGGTDLLRRTGGRWERIPFDPPWLNEPLD